MASLPTSEAWAQIRYDYEHTERTVEEICAEHGISSGTLRDRMRRWGWTRRRPLVPLEGPPPLPAPQIDAPSLASACALDGEPAEGLHEASPHPAASHALGGDPPPPEPAPGRAQARPGWEGKDGETMVPRLERAVARVLSAIEATVAKLGSGATHPRELERAARALAALTRTLRELNGLLSQHQASAADDKSDTPKEDIDAFRFRLARQIDALIASRNAEKEMADDDASTDRR